MFADSHCGFRSSKEESPEVVTRVMPRPYREKILCSLYICLRTLSPSTVTSRGSASASSLMPFALVLTSIFDFLRIPFTAYHSNIVTCALWEYPPPAMCKMSTLAKTANHPILLKASFFSHFFIHEDSMMVYTGRSKWEKGVDAVTLSRMHSIPRALSLLLRVHGLIGGNISAYH